MTEAQSGEMFFFIADISGYTSFMLKNKMDYTHAILVINHLMQSLMKEVEGPMKISKLEGDAIFLFLPSREISEEMRKNPAKLKEKLLHFFSVFARQVNELQKSNVCDCGGCANINKLELKIVAHFGQAVIDRVGSFEELSGVDVILVHRLLKNKVKEKCYLLMTEPVHALLRFSDENNIVRGKEKDPDLGEIPVYIHYPKEEPIIFCKREPSQIEKILKHAKLAWGSFLLKTGLMKVKTFHHLPPVKKGAGS